MLHRGSISRQIELEEAISNNGRGDVAGVVFDFLAKCTKNIISHGDEIGLGTLGLIEKSKSTGTVGFITGRFRNPGRKSARKPGTVNRSGLQGTSTWLLIVGDALFHNQS